MKNTFNCQELRRLKSLAETSKTKAAVLLKCTSDGVLTDRQKRRYDKYKEQHLKYQERYNTLRFAEDMEYNAYCQLLGLKS